MQRYRALKPYIIAKWRLNNKKRVQQTHKVYEQRNPECVAFWNAYTRCTNKKSRSYKDYGGRGIKFLLTSWKDIVTDIGKRPSNQYSLDRINNNGHYIIGNLRWATRIQQRNNRRKA